ncbi:hypothetical protein [Agrobacterium pusense]|uniref:hypothetical protein n=1 Tax=Agrobacterium pusense TaxID=648995 RepID=UPI000882ADCB|nr:hypothetical protein [Agrobacterium pusense]OOO23402.1 hypothetical protein BTE56_03185 [Agrobacterium pusense]WKD45033.1 hypothetical protein M8C82_16655 [Agrobacterium pusense]SDE62583.1 hypothetical protein SAMN05421750_102581 [Agrobacterium pusense]
MHIRPYILENHGVYPKRFLEDGQFFGVRKTTHDNLDQRLIAEVDRESDLTAYSGYVAMELWADDDDIPTGAKIEVLFSERKGIAAVLYDHPKISDAFIEWVFCNSPNDALTKWMKKVRWPLMETSKGPVDIIGDTQQ